MAGKAPREIRITNTLTGKRELLKTREAGKLTFYTCGPTVYNFIHIGNLRTALVADMMTRYFSRAGYEVTYVRNYTDVDDRIIQQSIAEKTTSDAVAKRYILEVEKDYAAAGMLEPTHKTTVTDHIAEIIAMIGKIIANGKAYVAADGEVLFSVESFEGYGKLSRKNLEELEAGARVEVSAKKRNPMDFALWKPAKPGEPSWPSPWCAGRPGWHIECSAMASRWLGEQIDVHHGAEDLIFPHHENEIAQSEAASGKAPFVAYWYHNAFLTLSKEKMSKSLGNVFLARKFLEQFGGEIARHLLLSHHPRSLIDFGRDAVDHTLTALTRIYEAKLAAEKLASVARALPDPRAEAAWGEFLASCEKARTEIDEAYAHDFNTPGALAAFFTLVREFNRTAAEPRAGSSPGAVLGARELIRVLEEDIGSVLGIGRLRAEKALEDLGRVRAQMRAEDAGAGAARMPASQIEALLHERVEARKAKDFDRADEIRKQLDAAGVAIQDGAGGAKWSYR